MKRFGLIGHPIAHSLSPSLFKAAYDSRYEYDLIESEDFEVAYQKFLDGYHGINVTAPFKETAFRKADFASDECISTGATNMLVKTSEGIKAYNSDYLGVKKWLKETAAGFPDEQRLNLLIAGFGGAGKAVAAAAESLGMNISIVNRTIKSEGIRPLTDFCKEFRKADIIIYNIPSPIQELGELTEDDIRGGENPRPKHILEANYRNPSFTEELICRIQKHNPLAKYTEGKVWLLYQAVTGYEIFTGEIPDLEKMRNVL